MYKIIVPYRDRESHLRMFADNAIPFFEETGREYKIIVVEQADGKPFNLGKLTNIGFDLYRSIDGGFKPEDSFVFQPVDCIPYDAHYDAPRGGIAKLASHYSTPRDPDDALAGILSRRTEWAPRASQVVQGEPRPHGVPYFYKAFSVDPVAYKRVNGFNNDCWGWGGEDNEFFIRLSMFNIKTVHRLCLYDMLDHELASLEFHNKNLNKANELLRHCDIYQSGLNTLQYSVKEQTGRFGIETYVCEV